jgi:hypothetical protein
MAAEILERPRAPTLRRPSLYGTRHVRSLALLWHFSSTKRNRLLQCGHRDGGVGEANSRALMARCNAGSVGVGGGTFSG